MDNKKLTEHLEQIELPDIELPGHRRRLKAALLESGRITEPTMTFKTFAPFGAAVCAVVALAVIGFSYTGGAPRTYALEVARKSIEAVSALSSEQMQALNAHLQSEAAAILNEAAQADDLTALSPDEVSGMLYSPSADALSESERESFAQRLAASDLEGARFLQFTNSEGERVIIAINQNNLPVYQIADAGAGEAEEIAVRSLVENFGKSLKFVSLLSPTAASDMQERYGAYVAPELLSRWKADPEQALGRLTSSPWPESILVTDVEKTDGGYEVRGTLLEVTSAEITKNAAMARPMTLTVRNVGDEWRITDVSVQAQ